MSALAILNESNPPATGSGQIAAGFLFLSVKNVGNSAVTVNGVSLPPGEPRTYPFVGKGYEQAVTYDATGGALQIMEIR